EREALVAEIGWDGITLLEKIYFGLDTPVEVRHLEAVEILRQIWLQQFVLMDDQLRQRSREEMPPAARIIQSPFDVEARYSHKRGRDWMSYKVHLTETCDVDKPYLITNVYTVNATQPDDNAVEPVHEKLHARNLLPDEHLVDMGYTSAALLFDSLNDYGVELLGPVWEKHSWQQATGYEIDAFTIDW